MCTASHGGAARNAGAARYGGEAGDEGAARDGLIVSIARKQWEMDGSAKLFSPFLFRPEPQPVE